MRKNTLTTPMPASRKNTRREVFFDALGIAFAMYLTILFTTQLISLFIK